MHYVGQELEVFQHALNWKAYWKRQIQPYIGCKVLEVGAGIGGTTRVFCDDRFDLWTALEPDPQMMAELHAAKERGEFPDWCEFRQGTVANLGAAERYDTVLYIDVLEHIEDDRGELERVAEHLEPGGHLIVLSPAYPFLYTAFDEAIGHHRRYTRSSLRALTPASVMVRHIFYLDAIAVGLSLGNKLMLRSPQPSFQQILFWDRAIVPLSRWVDPLLLYSIGRSVIGVWQRQPA
jgi:2-polyprenyl-3-methyl-5-hydroxy-6-metoxy-1,4-benzoquinol methylase